MMNFVAMVIALVLERLFTDLVHLRELPVLSRYAGHVVSRLDSGGPGPRLAIAIGYAIAPALVVFLVAATGLHNLSYVAYAVVVLLLSLGPGDLVGRARDYVAAARAGDAAAATIAAELREHDAAQRGTPATGSVADAVFVQANNRLFGVLFWFAVLGPAGPAGAVLFRVTDVLRRRAIEVAAARGVPAEDPVVIVLQRVHGALAWAPARLLALSFGVAGSFDDAFRGWRGYLRTERDEFFEENDLLLVHAGQGALGADLASLDEAAGVERALGLVRRSLYVWVAVLAALAVVPGA